MADIKERLTTFYQRVLDGHNLGVIEEFIAADCIEHTPPPIPDFKGGVEGVKQIMGMWFEAFPDVTVKVHEIIAEGNTVGARITWSGTHKGSMMGETPTGKTVEGHSIDWMKVGPDGKFTEHWSYGNDAEVMMALGVAPPS